MDFQDFPMILGNLGVDGDHPPKMCAGLEAAAVKLLGSPAGPVALVEHLKITQNETGQNRGPKKSSGLYVASKIYF